MALRVMFFFDNEWSQEEGLNVDQMIRAVILAASLLAPTLGMADDSSLIQQMIQEATQFKSDSLVILQNGDTVIENYFGGEDAVRSVQSVSKSITAIAIELLIDQGRIGSLDVPMSTWIPGWTQDPVKSTITLRMILSQTSGMAPDTDQIQYPGALRAGDLVAYSSNSELDATPGTQFLYSTMGVSLLQPVVAQAAGTGFTNYVYWNLFHPLGIEDAYWEKDQAGHEFAAGGLKLSTKDLVQVGKLMLGHGIVNGQSVLSERGWSELTQKSQSLHNYGLLWWLEQPGSSPALSSDPSLLSIFYAYGYGGQYLVVYPDKGLIGVRTNAANIRVTDPTEFEAEQYYTFLTRMAAW